MTISEKDKNSFSPIHPFADHDGKQNFEMMEKTGRN
jgi:hypothetical protein